MILEKNDDLIKELIQLALELGANKFYINKILLGNGISLNEAFFRGFISNEEEKE